MKKSVLLCVVLAVLVGVAGLDLSTPPVAHADGFIDFEAGVDGVAIQSSIPGLQFTTTEGYDWIYGDWRTDGYNGPYPDGEYYSNGNFFAWLGPNQGAGRIDFTQGCATYLQVWVSSAYGLNADAYYSDGTLAATASVPANLNSGQLARLRVDAPPEHCFSYVLLHDTENYWLIDDLSTDAGGVPSTRPPVIILPGLMGSRLRNNDSCSNREYEVWPDVANIAVDPFDSHLEHLRLQSNGRDPESSCDDIFSSEILRDISLLGYPVRQFYGPLIDHLDGMGFDVYTFDYDWRLDLSDTANDLDAFIDGVLAAHGTTQVSLVDHSLGGLLARHYITSDTAREQKVEQVISLGTPFLGAAGSLKALRWGDIGPNVLDLIGVLYAPRVKGLLQNCPAAYQILPTEHYFHVNGDGYYRVDGDMYSLDQTRFVIWNDHNEELAQDAENFHSASMDDWTSTQLDVAFRLIVGSGREDTPGVLHERTLLSWLGYDLITWDLEPTNGDGTVPLHSADLKGNGYDYSGGVPIWYTQDINHDQLVKEPYVMQFIAAILATPPNSTAMARVQSYEHELDPAVPSLYRGSMDRFPDTLRTATVPPTPPEMGSTPFALDGGQIAAWGAVALHVWDSSGNHTGPSTDGGIERNIPGSGYTALEDAAFATVPSGDTYTLQVQAKQDGEFDLKVRNLEGVDTDLVRRTLVYVNTPVQTESVAQLVYDPASTGAPPDLALDSDGDGTFEQSVPVTGDLDPVASQDTAAPDLDIQLDGEIGPLGVYVGQVEVTVIATDAGTGVVNIEYATSFGGTIHDYTGPFTVQAEEVSTVIARATDRAGNKATITARVGSIKMYLPLIVRNQ